MIHNGIIENFARLRAELEATGIEFASDTDTECAAHLLAAELRALRTGRRRLDGPHAARRGACAAVCRRLEGAFTLLAVDADTPGAVVGARRNSPLVVGRGDGENFLASDVSAFIEHTREAIELGQDQVVLITAGRHRDHRLRRRAGRAARTSTSTGTPRPPRRAATTTSCSRRSPSSRRPSPTPCAAG